MVPRWKKLAYSLVAAMVGSATFVAFLAAGSGKNPTTEGTLVIFGAGVAAWIVAIPLVLRIKNVSGWRFWLYLGTGSSYGPIIFFGWLLVPFIKRESGQAPNAAVIFVTLVAFGIFAIPFFVGTLTYLLWLRKAQKNALRPMDLAPSTDEPH